MREKNMVNRINDFLYKPIFFRDIEKKEGYVCLMFISVYMVGFLLVVLHTDREYIHLVDSLFNLIFCLVLIVTNINKLYTLGLRKTKLKETLITASVIFVLSLLINAQQIITNKVTIYDFVFNMLFALIAIGFVEEFIFRGYMWPRLVVLFGRHKGTLICGALFGLMHVISMCKYDNDNFDLLPIFNTIWEGIAGQYVFMFLYCYARNIYFPSILHAAPHFFAIERRVKKSLDLLKVFFY